MRTGKSEEVSQNTRQNSSDLGWAGIPGSGARETTQVIEMFDSLDWVVVTRVWTHFLVDQAVLLRCMHFL